MAADDDELMVRLTRTEALALEKLADYGLRVVEALGLVRTTTTTGTIARPAQGSPGGSA